jgi:ketosteroid isomerase-like protein
VRLGSASNPVSYAHMVKTSRAGDSRLVPISMTGFGLGGLWAGVGALLLVAASFSGCGGDAATTTTAAAATSALTTTASTAALPPTTLPGPTTTAPPSATEEAATLVEAFMAAWDAGDPDVISAFYADEVSSYDADGAGVAFHKDDIDWVLHNAAEGSFTVSLTSYFVSGDGRLAAVWGTYAERDDSGDLVPLPYVSLLALEDAQFVWIYDYYGGALDDTEPMPMVPPTVGVGSTEAQATAEATKATIERWVAAYNERDAEAFLSCYTEDARYVDVVSPAWRVLDKAGLAADVASHFPRPEFQSRFEPPRNSPVMTFFVSADGRLVAVQGSYRDGGMTTGKPMVAILELQGGAIVAQYNFIHGPQNLVES